MAIDQLPVEMLMKIFSYLPAPAYCEVSLVNKRFHGIACKMDNILRINQRLYERFLSSDEGSGQLMQSIVNRRITKVEIETIREGRSPLFEKEEMIISILQKISSTIKVMILLDYFVSEFCFREILSLIPNVEILHLHGVCLAEKNHLRSDNDLNLKKLRSLTIFCSNDEVLRVFDRLPIGILTKLRVKCEWNSLPTILNRQFNIKKLFIEAHFYDKLALLTDILDKLELESLELCLSGASKSLVVKALSKQTKLKSLIFSDNMVIDEQVFALVSGFLELEVLGIDLVDIRSASLVKMRKLKNLQLKLGDKENVQQLNSLAEMGFPVKKLSWRATGKNRRMSVDLIDAMAKFTPHLIDLNFFTFGFMDAKEQDAILRQFNSIEVLEICAGPLAEPSSYLNLRLRELIIEVTADMFYESMLTQLTASYPNVKALKVTILSVKKPCEIRPILNGFKKLESLALHSFNSFIIADLDCLHDYKDNLKLVSFLFLNEDSLTDEFVENMSKSFPMVNIFERHIVIVAGYPHTLTCERDTAFPYNISYSFSTL